MKDAYDCGEPSKFFPSVSDARCEAKRRRCARPPNTPPAVTSGGITRTMQRILSDFPQYSPKAISQPGGNYGPNAPWVLTLENFVSDEEADAFVSGCSNHFDRSLAGDQLSPVRTSYQCWCSQNECERHPLTQAVAQRISNLTRAPVRYMEPFQVVRYEVGQFYRQHHDQNSGLFTPQGPRVYTFFMYLSTPDAGGGTKFNSLGLTVPAVKGNAVLWPSIMNSDPRRDEPKTFHEALPVEKGVKFASNVWCAPRTRMRATTSARGSVECARPKLSAASPPHDRDLSCRARAGFTISTTARPRDGPVCSRTRTPIDGSSARDSASS